MNRKKTLWIAGWASNFSLWNDQIEKEIPNIIHTYSSYSEILHRETLRKRIDESAPDIIIAWSQGALSLLSQEALPDGVRIILLNPVFEFCHPDLGWNPDVLRRMIAGLNLSPEKVLRDFAHNMGPAGKSEKTLWIDSALKNSVPDLISGLEQLAKGKITRIPAEYHKIITIFGFRDEIVPRQLTEHFAARFKSITFRPIESMDHWPLSPASMSLIKQIINEQ